MPNIYTLLIYFLVYNKIKLVISLVILIYFVFTICAFFNNSLTSDKQIWKNPQNFNYIDLEEDEKKYKIFPKFPCNSFYIKIY